VRPNPVGAGDGALPEYRLNSDLAQYCLPSANRDDARRLAWANSICLMFLTVAILGVRQPVFVIREVDPLPEPLPVVILPPPTEPETQPQVAREEPEEAEQPDDDVEIPVVAPVIVAAAQDASFSVPVEGFTALSSDARFVPPPPAIIPKAPPPDALPKADFRNIRFGGKEFRKQPPPGYPDEFSRNRIGGTVEALITVTTNGLVSKVEVGRSSGFPALDRHVTEFIRKEWKAEPGEGAFYRIAITFAP
jgi:protein TonB